MHSLLRKLALTLTLYCVTACGSPKPPQDACADVPRSLADP